MYHDGIVHPHPPVSRCLQETVNAIKHAGHTVVPWDPNLHKDLVSCIDQAYFLDGGEEYYEVLEAGNEPPTPLMKWILDKTDRNSWSLRDTWKVCSNCSILILGKRILINRP